MFRPIVFFTCFFLFAFVIFAQPHIISGPMLGPVELRDAKVWIEVSPEVKAVSLQYNKKGEIKSKTVLYKGVLGNEFNPLQFTVGGLDFNTTYQYKSPFTYNKRNQPFKLKYNFFNRNAVSFRFIFFLHTK